jgi:hypothetical protein
VVPIATGDAAAFIATEIWPVKLPEETGVNVTDSVRLSTGASVTGAVKPEALKPAPVTSTRVMVRVPALAFVNATFCDPLLPMETSPNATADGLAERRLDGAETPLHAGLEQTVTPSRPQAAVRLCRAKNAASTIDVLDVIVAPFLTPGGCRTPSRQARVEGV